jgi:peroxiredoxin
MIWTSIVFCCASLPPARIDHVVELDSSVPVLKGGGTASLSDLKGKGSLVLFFFSADCGVTFYYKSRIQKLQADFQGRGFRFVGVLSGQRLDPSQPLHLAETGYLSMPFLNDSTGNLVRQFGVGQSLTFAVIDRQNKLRYFGGFDDEVDERMVKQRYLRDALLQLNRGQDPKNKHGEAIGCAIIPILKS